jgi:crotonobetainyl-CoA:carnitine CoA-transferase CaiB-like acyl-CoA transferase
MGSALDGINLIEFASNLGAAYAAMLMAEQGARAIRVESATNGADGRSTPHYHVLNRSKRLLKLDFDAPLARREVEQLLKWADVVITGTTPSRLQAMGLDGDSIARVNPHAIALNVPPLGSRGPDADFDANDDLVAARSGITGDQWALSGDPVALVFPAASYSAGVMGAIAATSALMVRGASGRGQAVEVSLLAGAFSLQTGAIIRHEKMTRLYHGPQDPLGPIPCYRLFEASDGRYLFIACGNATFFGKLAIAIDHPELTADPRFENAPWGVPEEHRQALKDIIGAVIRTRTCAEWISILRENDVPCAPVMTRHEFIEWSQTRALNMHREIDDPVLGRTIQMGVPIVLNATPGEIRSATAADDNGRAAREWLSEPPRRPDPASAVKAASNNGPLSGVLVLDFASYIAGSYGPMILAQLGADVIKIESLEGDSFRHFGFGFLGWNQGKRGLALNLGSPEGRDIILRLAERADVVVENLRPGRMRRFGIDYAPLSARNPRIIYMSVNGFGNQGPEHNHPGFDPLLQARSGVMAAQGGPHGHPVYLTCAICDYGAAMLSALGCVLALRARELTGRGQFCETSLLQASMAFQAGEFIFYDGRPDMENGHTEYRGRSALSRAYRCRDGEWLFISVSRADEWSALRKMFASLQTLDFAAASREPNDGALASALESEFARVDRSDALPKLIDARVPATPVHHFADLFDDLQVIANELTVELPHSQWGKVKQLGTLAKFSSTPGRVERSAPLLGEHTEEILRNIAGYDAAQIAAFRDGGIIR